MDAAVDLSTTRSPLPLDDLRAAVDAQAIDTVLLCLADMQGRLQGKRLTAHHFLDEALDRLAERGLTAVGATELEFIVVRDS